MFITLASVFWMKTNHVSCEHCEHCEHFFRMTENLIFAFPRRAYTGKVFTVFTLSTEGVHRCSRYLMVMRNETFCQYVKPARLVGKAAPIVEAELCRWITED